MGTLLALFGAYLLAWRAWACTEITRLNDLTQPRDIESYITQHIGFRKLCGFGDYASSVFIFVLGLSITMYAWHTLTPKAGEH